jgi:hypothetical protein
MGLQGLLKVKVKLSRYLEISLMRYGSVLSYIFTHITLLNGTIRNEERRKQKEEVLV